MRRLSLIILCCFLLSGCIFDPAFDMSSFESYQASLAAVRSKLDDGDRRRLDIALKYLAVENAVRAGANFQMVSDIGAAANGLSPIATFVQLRSRINGESARAVILDLSIRLDAEISRADAKLPNGANPAGPVEVTTAPGYYWKREGRIERPTVEFAVFNGSKSPISRMYFRIALVSPDRSIPWAREEYVENFKGGLEPRERRQLSLHPYGDWSDPQLKYLTNARLKVDVLNYEDANGLRMMIIDRESLELKRKVRAALA